MLHVCTMCFREHRELLSGPMFKVFYGTRRTTFLTYVQCVFRKHGPSPHRGICPNEKRQCSATHGQRQRVGNRPYLDIHNLKRLTKFCMFSCVISFIRFCLVWCYGTHNVFQKLVSECRRNKGINIPFVKRNHY